MHRFESLRWPLVLLVVCNAACWRAIIHPGTAMTRDQVKALAVDGWQFQRVVGGDEDEAVELVGLVRPPQDQGARWVLLFGGNGMRLRDNQWVLTSLFGEADLGLAVFAYRGYDTSEGSPSQESLWQDAVVLPHILEDRFGAVPANLVVMGQSLGTGIAAKVAASLSAAGTPPERLVLVSAYTSMAEVVNDQVPLVPVGWSVSDDYPTESLVETITCPVLLVHGLQDGLISVSHGRRLKQKLGDRARLVEVSRAHNNLWAPPSRAAQSIRDWLQLSSSSTGPRASPR